MGRRFLIACVILISLISPWYAYAQEAEDTILGLSISSLLIIFPVVLMIIGLLFFLGLYLKDHYEDISRFFRIRFKRAKIKGAKEKVIDYPQELQTLQKKLPDLEPEDAILQLSNLAKKFFAEKFKIDYEFTHGELEKELEKEKAEWASFPKKLSNLRYSGEPVTEREVKEIIKEFWDIVKYERRKRLSLTVVEKLKKRRLSLEIGILTNLKRYLQKIKPKEEKVTSKDVLKYIVKRQKQRLGTLTSTLNKVKTDAANEIRTQLETIGKIQDYFTKKLTERKIDRLLDLLEEAKKQMIQGKINEARDTYKQAYSTYYKLPIEEQAHILTELQKVQQQINQYKPQPAKETPIEQIKKYVEEKITRQKINKANELIKEAYEQITQGKIEQARNTYKQAYSSYYKLPIEEQAHVLFHLRKIGDQVKELEREKEQEELGELAQELGKLKSEREVYVILDKKDITKKLNSLISYAQKVEKQGVHGIKAGKIHLKERLKDLSQTASKIEEKEERKLTHQERTFLAKLKEISTFYSKKETALEKALKQKQKQLFEKLYDITKRMRTEFYPKATEKTKIKQIPKPQPYTPPLPKESVKKTEKIKKIEGLIEYLKKKEKEGLYTIKPAGKEFLYRIGSIIRSVKESEQRGITSLEDHEKDTIDLLTPFITLKEGEIIHPSEEEKRMLEFLEHMKDEEMISIEEQKLQKEKEKLEPLIESQKVRLSISRWKKLQEEEEELMKKLQTVRLKHPLEIPKTPSKRLERYDWEIKADEIKMKKTKNMSSLLKEEEKLLSKLKRLQ